MALERPQWAAKSELINRRSQKAFSRVKRETCLLDTDKSDRQTNERTMSVIQLVPVWSGERQNVLRCEGGKMKFYHTSFSRTAIKTSPVCPDIISSAYLLLLRSSRCALFERRPQYKTGGGERKKDFDSICTRITIQIIIFGLGTQPTNDLKGFAASFSFWLETIINFSR